MLARGAPSAASAVQVAVVAVTTAASTLVRFVLMRSWIFRPAPAALGSGRDPAHRHTASVHVDDHAP